MRCHSLSVIILYRPLNFDRLWALNLLVVGDICLDLNLELASRRVVDLCGVARYVRHGKLTKWLALACVCSFETRMVTICLCRLEP
jgi:hypothetical protein